MRIIVNYRAGDACYRHVVGSKTIEIKTKDQLGDDYWAPAERGPLLLVEVLERTISAFVNGYPAISDPPTKHYPTRVVVTDRGWEIDLGFVK